MAQAAIQSWFILPPSKLIYVLATLKVRTLHGFLVCAILYYVLGASLLTYSSYKNQFLSIVGLVKNGTTATPPANGLDLGVTSPNLHTMNMIFQLQTQSLHEG